MVDDGEAYDRGGGERLGYGSDGIGNWRECTIVKWLV